MPLDMGFQLFVNEYCVCMYVLWAQSFVVLLPESKKMVKSVGVCRDGWFSEFSECGLSVPSDQIQRRYEETCGCILEHARTQSIPRKDKRRPPQLMSSGQL